MPRYAANLLAVPPDARYLTRTEAAEYLRVSDRYLRLETSRGNIAAFKLGRRVLYSREDLDAYMQRNRVQPGDALDEDSE